jgi:hypothetical protein
VVDRLTPRIVDETEFGFGWISAEKPKLALTSHALAADGGTWLVDPTDEPSLDERVSALGEPRGVIQLLDRHNRGCAAVARRLDVPYHRVPFDGVAEAPFEFVRVVDRFSWDEVALWWPERRVLATADALGTVPHYFALDGERVGVHPLLRLTPPRQLARLESEHLFVGHGEVVHEDAAVAIGEAVAQSRRRLVRLPLELVTARRRAPAERDASAAAGSRR